jgi:hypothetical protein
LTVSGHRAGHGVAAESRGPMLASKLDKVAKREVASHQHLDAVLPDTGQCVPGELDVR